MPRSAPDGARTDQPLRIARVAVEGAPFHLGDTLDYLAPDEDLAVGHRVELNLAGRRTRGLVTALDDRSEVPVGRLRPLGRRLGDVPWTDEGGIGLLAWAAGRFGAPLGDVVRHAFPGRVVDEERRATEAGWWPPRPRSAGPAADRAEDAPSGVEWADYGEAGAGLLGAVRSGGGSYLLTPRPGEDLAALVADLADRTLEAGRDVLVIVPGPVSAVADRVLGLVREDERVDLRGGPSQRMAYRAWLRARAGLSRVVVGERSAVFTPLSQLGLAVVVDEADPMHKERRSPRHHAREVVLERARRAGAVGLATVDVPSAGARALVDEGRLTLVRPSIAVVGRDRPVVRLETGVLEARARVSRSGMRVLRDAVAAGGYGVVLAARRGEGRSLVCGRCGDLVRCTRCSASVARAPTGGWWCAACGAGAARAPRCERCGPGPLSPLAAGAERLREELARSIDAPVVALEGHAPDVPDAPAVLVMTRGSVLDRPPTGGRVNGVVLPDLDGSLRRPTLDAAEDALRLAFRVAGWTAAAGAGRGARDASLPEVVVDTRDPSHHALRALVAWDMDSFWREEIALRAALCLPPVRRAIRIELGTGAETHQDVLRAVVDGDRVLGPLPLEGGRTALIVLCEDREATLRALRPLRELASRQGSNMRLDVDPIDLG